MHFYRLAVNKSCSYVLRC